MIPKYSARVEWSRDDDAWVASSPEFPGLAGIDAEAGAALRELHEAIEMAVEVLLEDGERLPDPIQLAEHSGQFRVRVPRALHAALVRGAAADGVSLNAFVTTFLAAGVGEHGAETRARAELEKSLRTLRDVSRRIRPASSGSRSPAAARKRRRGA